MDLRDGIVVPLFDRPGADVRRVVGVLSVGLVDHVGRSTSKTSTSSRRSVNASGLRWNAAAPTARARGRRAPAHALLPDAVPVVAGVDNYAVRYRPSTAGVQVGGDWYDVVETPTGVWISVGDVVGHGVEAAAFMGLARPMLRALTVDEHLPKRALSRLDAAVFAMPDDPFVTVVLARLRDQVWLGRPRPRRPSTPRSSSPPMARQR